jgi:hypothetical protein
MQPLCQWDPSTETWGATSNDLFSERWVPYSETWPTWGSMHDGVAYELPTSAPRTADSESSSLLPTPLARDSKGAPGGGFNEVSLPRSIQLLPTPRATDVRGPIRHGAGGLDLRTTVNERLLPTPRAQDSDESPKTFLTRTRALQEFPDRNGGQTGPPLGVAVQMLTDGVPMDQRSDDGKGSSAGQLPAQLSLESTGSLD